MSLKNIREIPGRWREDGNSIQSLISEFQKRYSLIQSTIAENQSILESNDSSKLLKYISKNDKITTIPSRYELKVPEFTFTELMEQALCQIIGDIPETKKTYIQGKDLIAPHSELHSERPIKEFLDSPLIVGNIKTDESIFKIACVPNTDQFYVSGLSTTIKHMNTEGKVLEKITTTGMLGPKDLTVTREGVLVYCSGNFKSINKVKNGKVECMISLKDWKPQAICSTQTDDLLVYMTLKHGFEMFVQRKVVRYNFDSAVRQEVQLSVVNKDLMSSYVPHIDENKNLDIVVSDTNSIFVFNKDVRFRFIYCGNPMSNKYKTFTPCGITTNSICHILIGDSVNNFIHIIDRNGQFLRHIDNCDLYSPYCDLCTDSNDILFVVQLITQEVKQIKYME
ncbi:uncharacterized protein LOC133204296 [Saccostrea echinata]|uniref:uncharacterized protein LOC133204296 n=1 Tax=Saccostrea echinata TaxID=191078 RepID=UPI002A83F2AF|nr:uncharacterized protein LOC133204296 [Saccostrea echinata]